MRLGSLVQGGAALFSTLAHSVRPSCPLLPSQASFRRVAGRGKAAARALGVSLFALYGNKEIKVQRDRLLINCTDFYSFAILMLREKGIYGFLPSTSSLLQLFIGCPDH